MSGLTDHGRQLALHALLPPDTIRYVGFLTVLPDNSGTGGVEAVGSGYSRKGHLEWINTVLGSFTYRVNNSAIEFSALTADLEGITGWGIWDEAVGGNLLAFGPLLDVNNKQVTKTFAEGNQPRFIAQELEIGID